MEVHGGRTDSAVLVPLFSDAATAPARRLHQAPRRPAPPRGRDLVPRRPPRRRRDAASRPPCARPGRRSGCRRDHVDVRRRARARRHVRHQLRDLSVRGPDRARLRVGRRRRPRSPRCSSSRSTTSSPATRSSAWSGAGWRSRPTSTRSAATWSGARPPGSSATCCSGLEGGPLTATRASQSSPADRRQTSSGICQVSELCARSPRPRQHPFVDHAAHAACRRASPRASAAGPRGIGPGPSRQPARRSSRRAGRPSASRSGPGRRRRARRRLARSPPRGRRGSCRARRGRRRAARAASARPRQPQGTIRTRATRTGSRRACARACRGGGAARSGPRSSARRRRSRSRPRPAGERVGFQSRMSSAERLQNTPEQDRRRSRRRRPRSARDESEDVHRASVGSSPLRCGPRRVDLPRDPSRSSPPSPPC